MRLTLRTLLAYLDDTLDPAEIKQIGQKVAESDAAQELIARIRQVTRRRRLTTPPATGPNARFDANTVADYLDSNLPSEQVAEVEKTCLDSDVHLAEIAACHQILTLVLGEPVLVPPLAKRRMYALVQGKEAVPRKASPRKPATAMASGEGHEADDTLLLGLPPWSRIQSMRWLVPAAAALLVAGLAAALWMAIPPRDTQLAFHPRPTNPEKPLPDPTRDRPLLFEPEPELLAMKPRLIEEIIEKKEKPVVPAAVTPANSKPSTERRVAGKPALVNPPSVLLQRPRGKEDWQRLQPNISPVYTSDQLVSLPGFLSEVRLDNKVLLLLWGNLDEAVRSPSLESAVTLHAVGNQPGAPDVDLTLNRGRIVLTNQRAEPARIRVRFHEEIWDLTLQDQGSEVGLDLIGREGGFESGDGPLAALQLLVLKGQARLKIGYQEYALQAPPGPAMFIWDNRGPGPRGPLPLQQLPPEWNKLPPPTKEYRIMETALEGLSGQIAKDKIASKLYDNLSSPDPATRKLATLSLGAIDALPELLDALADERFPEVREAAVSALRHWLGREAGQDKKLKQALADKGYTTSQTDILLQLLHTFSGDDLAKKQTYEVLIEYLRHNKPAVRQLAFWHLLRLVPEARKIPYDPGRGGKQMDDAYEQWKKLLADGKLPPKPPSGPPMPPK